MVTDICGKTLLTRVLERLEDVAGGEPQILAIPDDTPNDSLETLAIARHWRVIRGSESDVLGRYAKTIRKFGVERFVRATGDNPLFDVEGVRKVMAALDRSTLAYGVGYPRGGIFAAAHASALLEANLRTNDPYDREHVMPYIHKHPKLYPVAEIKCPWEGAEKFRLTVDTADDIAFTRRIFGALGDSPSFDSVMEFLKQSSKDGL